MPLRPRRELETSPAVHGAKVEEDEEEEDDDEDDLTAGKSDCYSSAAEDLLPPIQAYGHTYHGSGRVLLPNDAAEAQRQAVQHELFRLCLDGRLVAARLPLDKPGKHTPRDPSSATRGPAPAHGFRILDVGSGSGLWACAMAAAYPRARVLGIDLSGALLPARAPPNCTFEVADAAEASFWRRPTNPGSSSAATTASPPSPPRRRFDLIHMRNLVGGGVPSWRALLAAAYDSLHPGGQLEFAELRPRFYALQQEQPPPQQQHDEEDKEEQGAGPPLVGPACAAYERAFGDACARAGVDFDPVPRVCGWLADMGADVVRERVDWLPVGSWGRDAVMRKKSALLGEMFECGEFCPSCLSVSCWYPYWTLTLAAGLENWTLMLFGETGWKEAETRALLERVKQEVRDPNVRSYMKM